jgi:hypothetical protein
MRTGGCCTFNGVRCLLVSRIAVLPLILLLAACPPARQFQLINASGADVEIRLEQGRLAWPNGATITFVDGGACEQPCVAIHALRNGDVAINGRVYQTNVLDVITADGSCKRFSADTVPLSSTFSLTPEGTLRAEWMETPMEPTEC